MCRPTKSALLQREITLVVIDITSGNTHFQNLRELYLPPYYCKYPSVEKCVSIMSDMYYPHAIKLVKIH